MVDHQNKAIWLNADATHSLRIIREQYVPTGAQSLVKVQYSAINPADTRHAYMGMSEYVAGYEFQGEVVQTGPDSPFKPGQSVFGFSKPYDGRPAHLGAHQDFLLAEPFLTRLRPDDMSPLTAVCLPAASQTSIDALFNCLGFALPAAGLEGDDPTDVPILIWGGSGAVGQGAIRLARAAAFAPILTTASPRNHALLRELGATHCFDYREADVVAQIRAKMDSLPGQKKLRVAFDAVATGLGVFEGLSVEEEIAVRGRYSQSSPGLARQCCDDDYGDLKLSSVMPVYEDPAWKFCLTFRSVDTMDHGGVWDDADLSVEERRQEEEQTVRMGERTERAMNWILANHKEVWPEPRTRVVSTVNEALKAIEDVWKGRVSGEKMVIEHPMKES